MRPTAAVALCSLLLVVVACGAPEPGASPSPSPTPAPTPRPPDRPDGTPPPVGAVPREVLNPILDDAARRTGVAREQLVIERAEAVVWSDGSLGCPNPGEMYIQVLIDGYWVEVRAGDELLDYHGGGGSFKLCPPGRARPPVGGRGGRGAI